ncbi:putative outer capsid protein P6, partial [Grapevine Cabernet Sauvignon reovirus]|uniref:putative outer capsid protein P6 n=1 Tax=Grapevine Cabernet Sauvignon reovirus TaxID=1640277 RepID=UPI0006BDA498
TSQDFNSDRLRQIYLVEPEVNDARAEIPHVAESDQNDEDYQDYERMDQDPQIQHDPIPMVADAAIRELVPARMIENVNEYNENVSDSGDDEVDEMVDNDNVQEGPIPQVEDQEDQPAYVIPRLSTVRSVYLERLFARRRVGEDQYIQIRPRFAPDVVPDFATVMDFNYKTVPQDGWLNEAGLELSLSGGLINGERIPVSQFDNLISLTIPQEEQTQTNYVAPRPLIFNVIPKRFSPVLLDDRVNLEGMLLELLQANVLPEGLLDRIDQVCGNYLYGTEPQFLDRLTTPAQRNSQTIVMTVSGLVCSCYNTCPKKYRNSIVPIEVGRQLAVKVRQLIATIREGTYVDVTTLFANWFRLLYPEAYMPLTNQLTNSFFHWKRMPAYEDFHLVVPFLEGAEDQQNRPTDLYKYWTPTITPEILRQSIRTLPFFRLLLDVCSTDANLPFEERRNTMSENMIVYLKIIFHCLSLAYVLYWDPCDPSYYLIGMYPPNDIKSSVTTKIISKANPLTEKAFI